MEVEHHDISHLFVICRRGGDIFHTFESQVLSMSRYVKKIIGGRKSQPSQPSPPLPPPTITSKIITIANPNTTHHTKRKEREQAAETKREERSTKRAKY